MSDDIDAVDNDGRTALIWSTANNNFHLMKMLISAGANLNLKDNDESTALMVAAELNNITALNILLDAGADVNIKNNYDASALQMASRNDHFDCFHRLMVAGADYKNSNSNYVKISLLMIRNAELEAKNCELQELVNELSLIPGGKEFLEVKRHYYSTATQHDAN